jgi:hypothetical protein
MSEIERNRITTLLHQWEEGIIDERQVHEQAEECLEQLSELPSYAEENPRSIPLEVLVQLDALNHQLITTDDIPAILTFLNTPLGKEPIGWAFWRKYWDDLDLEHRREELKSNPYYCT